MTDSSTEGSIKSPLFSGNTTISDTSQDTIDSTQDKSRRKKDYLSPFGYLKDRFTPKTLKFLDEEIKQNSENLNNLGNVCNDDMTKVSVNENLLEERKYLLQQKSKHLASILHEASEIPLKETDVDTYFEDLSNLKDNVDNLVKKSETLRDRSLFDNKDK